MKATADDVRDALARAESSRELELIDNGEGSGVRVTEENSVEVVGPDGGVLPCGNDEDWAEIAAELIPTKWERFTKRTEDPKLAWLERQLTAAGIKHRRNGHSFHAPILEVQADKIDEAWEILTPVDDIPDDDPRWL
jgi:hypothetical protein